MRLLNTRQLLRMLIHRIRLVNVHPTVYVEFSYQLKTATKMKGSPFTQITDIKDICLHVLENIVVKCNTAAAWL